MHWDWISLYGNFPRTKCPLWFSPDTIPCSYLHRAFLHAQLHTQWAMAWPFVHAWPRHKATAAATRHHLSSAFPQQKSEKAEKARVWLIVRQNGALCVRMWRCTLECPLIWEVHFWWKPLICALIACFGWEFELGAWCLPYCFSDSSFSLSN